MSDKDSKFQQQNANFERQGLNNTSPSNSSFNAQAARGAELAQASDRAKEMINDQEHIFGSLMQEQLMREEKYRESGVNRERSKLYEKQFNSPQPIPNDPQAIEVMKNEIEQGAVRNYEKRTQQYRDSIEKNHERIVGEILKMDREGQLPERGQSHDHSHGIEHERDGH